MGGPEETFGAHLRSFVRPALVARRTASFERRAPISEIRAESAERKAHATGGKLSAGPSRFVPGQRSLRVREENELLELLLLLFFVQ